MIYALTDIEAHIPPERLGKGWQLFTDGRVAAPNVQRGGELVTAVIPQAGGRSLRVYIRAVKCNNTVTIDGECSCPKKKNCEHVAAVLLQALEDQQALPGTGIPAPPPTRGRAAAGTKAAAVQQALLYVVYLDEDGVLVEPTVARRLKRGGYSVVRYFEPGRAGGRTPARFLEPVDLELLHALDILPRAPDAGVPMLDGPQSAPILDALLATGRCFLDDAERGAPLGTGPKRRLEFLWLVDEFGHQQPRARITPRADVLVPLSSPRYLDWEQGQCGPVDTPLPAELVRELVALPAIPPQEADKVFKRLRRAWPDAPLAPPQRFELEAAPRVKPVPRLRLISVEERILGDWREYSDYACLSFDYDGITLARHGPSTRWDGTRIVRVQRDGKAERAAVKRLKKLGLEPVDSLWDPGREPERQGGEERFCLDTDLMDNGAEAWLDFQLEHVPALQAHGWRIEYDNFRYRLAEATKWVCDVDRLAQQDWFSIGLGVEVDGRRIDLLPVLLELLGHFPRGLPDRADIATEHFVIPFEDEQGEVRLLRLPAERVLPLLETLLEAYEGRTAAAKQRLRLNRVQLARLTALDRMDGGPPLQWRADDDVRELARRLRGLDAIAEVAPPAGLKANLRPYQRQGLSWLQFLREYGFAGILADDMGLGKTVQVLAHLLLEKEAGRADRPSLVIAPTSLMSNWRHEAQRFAPQLKALVLHGPRRKERFAAIAEHDLVITTYPLLARDTDILLAHAYHLLILDEAQVIKNPKARASRVVRDLDAGHRLCLTGTPLENHLGELWSLFDFLLPGLLGNNKQFHRFFRTPVEKHGNQAAAERLGRRIRPFLLRRTKEQVAPELPAKTEIVQTVALEGRQRELYETVRLAMHRRVRAEIERQGLARSRIVVLDALLKLRQVCCDPRLVDMDKARAAGHSAKLETLMALLPEMIEEGRRILLFSQFTTMLGLIEAEAKQAGIDYVKLTGRTRDRRTPIQRFQDGKTPLFLISLKAGGVGLNLTAADTVIHYDPWWNPAVERQATDRAHRIGQQQAVFVYKLICEGTVEERMHAIQQRKQALAEGLYQDGANHEPQWDEKDLEALFGPLNAAEDRSNAGHDPNDSARQGGR